MQDRRGASRMQVPVLVEFLDPATAKPQRSFTHDLSVSGTRFPTTVKFQAGQELNLTLAIPSHDAPFFAMAEVIWIREVARLGDTQYDVGVRFRWVEDLDLQRLSRFLQSVPAPAV